MSHDHKRGTQTILETYLIPNKSQSSLSSSNLLHHFDQLFQIHPNIDEVGINYIDSSPTKTYTEKDAFELPESNKLGIAAWSLRQLFTAAKLRFDTYNHTRTNSAYKDVHKITRSLLLLHPYSYSAWNLRKSSVLLELENTNIDTNTKTTTAAMPTNAMQHLLAEFSFIDLVFTTHPKISEAWEHRSWCLKQWKQTMQYTNSNVITDMLQHELEICELVAERYPKNYFAWSHRQHVINISRSIQSSENNYNLILFDLKKTGKWCHLHPSDHASFHHRQFLWIILFFGTCTTNQGLRRKKMFKRWPTFVTNVVNNYDTYNNDTHNDTHHINTSKTEPIKTATNDTTESRPINLSTADISMANALFDSHYDVNNALYNIPDNRDTIKEEKILLIELNWLVLLISNHSTSSVLWSHRQFIIAMYHIIRPDKYLERMHSEMNWIDTTMNKNNTNNKNNKNNNKQYHYAMQYLKWLRRNVAPFNSYKNYTTKNIKHADHANTNNSTNTNVIQNTNDNIEDQERIIYDTVLTWNIVISYIGRPFAGFQRQADSVEVECKSVQGVLEEIVRTVLVDVWLLHTTKDNNDSNDSNETKEKITKESIELKKSKSKLSSKMKFPGWVMVNGDRTDRGCNALHHDIEVMVCRVTNASAFASWNAMTLLELCIAMNQTLHNIGMKMVLSSTDLKNEKLSTENDNKEIKIYKRKMKKAARRNAEKLRMLSNYKTLPLYVRVPNMTTNVITTTTTVTHGITKIKTSSTVRSTGTNQFTETPTHAAHSVPSASTTRCKKYTYYLSEGKVNHKWIEKTWYQGQNKSGKEKNVLRPPINYTVIQNGLNILKGWHDFTQFGGKKSSSSENKKKKKNNNKNHSNGKTNNSSSNNSNTNGNGSKDFPKDNWSNTKKSGVRYVIEATITNVTKDIHLESFTEMVATGNMVSSTNTSTNKNENKTETNTKDENVTNETDVADDGEKWRNETTVWAVTVVASGFLNHMMRRIVGTLREIGEGYRPMTDLYVMLNGELESGPAAPARGLWRMGIEYRILPKQPEQSMQLEQMEQPKQIDTVVHLNQSKQKNNDGVQKEKKNAKAVIVNVDIDVVSNSNMEQSSVVEQSRQSGGHIVGNFPKYYDFNPIHERLCLFSTTSIEETKNRTTTERTMQISKWTSCLTNKTNNTNESNVGNECNVVLLDVGCNSGDLSLGLLNMLQNEWKDSTSSSLTRSTSNDICLLGIDVDDALIKRAKMKIPETTNVQHPTIIFHTADICNQNDIHQIHVLLDQLRHTNQPSTKQISSVAASDITFVFGITMWIHLHHGDEGVRSVLHTLGNMTLTTMVIEIHPWKNYKSAIKRIKKQKLEIPIHWKSIVHRGPGETEKFVQRVMLEIGYEMKYNFGSTGWGREVHSYERVR